MRVDDSYYQRLMTKSGEIGLVSINYNELGELLKTIAQTDITELILKSEDFELTVRKGMTLTSNLSIAGTPAEVVTSPVTPSVTPSPSVTVSSDSPVIESTLSPLEKKWVAITSPMVGTFYRAPNPDETPFVDINERIQIGQTVCIIEAMKLMNEIEAEVAGQVMEIAVTNGEPVEYGQTLLWINPNS